MSSMNYCQIGYVDCLLDAVDYLILCLLFMQYYGVVLSVTLQGFLARLAPFHRLFVTLGNVLSIVYKISVLRARQINKIK